MPYDVDGTEVGYRGMNSTATPAGIVGLGIQSWLSADVKLKMNNELKQHEFSIAPNIKTPMIFWFFFPEIREVTHVGFLFSGTGSGDLANSIIEGSSDTTNGVDGTWEPGTIIWPPQSNRVDGWREYITPVSFSSAKKVIRLGLFANTYNRPLNAVQLYGYKAATETPDDLLFVDDSTGAEKTALMDWGDRPEGTTEIDSFKIKNASADKIANDINLQLNHDDFLMSWSADGPWAATLDIATLGIGALSNTIYVRNKLGPPLLVLGPKSARVIAAVGSWT